MTDTTDEALENTPSQHDTTPSTSRSTSPVTTPADPSTPPLDNADATLDNDDFDDFGDFDEGDFDNDITEDFEDDLTIEAQNTTAMIPPPITPAEEYIKALHEASHPRDAVSAWLETFWPVEYPSQEAHSPDTILCTKRSSKLWEKLSNDAMFYNPITGTSGPLQWTRSETNKAYLRALGVTINYEEKQTTHRPTAIVTRPLSSYRESPHTMPRVLSEPPSGPLSASVSMSRSMFDTKPMDRSHHGRSSSVSGIMLGPRQPSDDDEPELDLDIAKAYCELTEETIRVFPEVKLKAMATEMARLQRQASDYLGSLLDQREQLLMDAETYNELIGCIVGHAQRLREQHVAKDASPAMVSKRKSGQGGGFLRRKPAAAAAAAAAASTRNGTSMGGGVVGVQQPQQKAKERRSM